ncbi:MAG: Hsp20/alpha crystallin family protein [Tepidisphaera sp.]
MNNLGKYESRPTLIPISKFLESVFSDPFFTVSANGVDEGALALDISEDSKHVIVRASLPGFTKENIEAEVHDGVLTIKATQSEQSEEKSERFYRKERRFGSVSRRVALPCAVTEAEAKAEFINGVLTLRLPKSVKDAPRKVAIN